MRPPACVSCKWGTGTVCEKPSNSIAQKEMEKKLKEMQEARMKQDQAWFEPPKVDTKETNQKNKNEKYSS